MNSEIRVLIADDHPLIRKGLASLLNSEPGIRLVGEAVDGLDAIQKAQNLQPDVMIVDLVMPEKNGVEVICEVTQILPDTKILVLTSFSEDDLVFPAIRAGAMGYLLKDTDYEELIKAIREVFRGESSMHPTIARMLIQEFVRPQKKDEQKDVLSDREVEVLQLVARGLSNREIGKTLFLSERTISVHVQSILEKLHAANRTQAAFFAIRKGIVNLDTPPDEK